MNKKEAKRFVYASLASFLDTSSHENQFIEEDSMENPLNENDAKLCKDILVDIVKSFRLKSIT